MDKSSIYVTATGKTLSLDELGRGPFYQALTSHRFMLHDIPDEKTEIKHLIKTILESNSTYFVVIWNTSTLDATLVLDKVELAKILIKHDFVFSIAYADYVDYLLLLGVKFQENISDFKNSNDIEIVMSYDDMSTFVRGITMDNRTEEIWGAIENWWKQKEKFLALD